MPLAISALHIPEGLTAQVLVISEIFEGLAVLVPTAILAALERKRIDAYGLPVRLAFGKHFWEGTAIGVLSAGAVGVAMIASGAMVVNGLALQGAGSRKRRPAMARRNGARRPKRGVHVPRLSSPSAKPRDGVLAWRRFCFHSFSGRRTSRRPDETPSTSPTSFCSACCCV